jgi:catechol 2,3-dioxygenase-like lactoylglutathione lyase family enzyme
MKISKLDHFVLTVRDIEKTISFYTSVMGMEKEAFGHPCLVQLIYALLQRLH